MPNPVRNDTSMTLDDLILRVAEAYALADHSGDTAAVPSSVHDYDLCKRAVNDGIEMIYRANPRWSFLIQTVEFTLSTDGSGPWCIDSDPGRYRLPWYVTGQPESPVVRLTGSQSTVYQTPVVAMKIVQDARASGADDNGPPVVAGVDRLPGSLSNRSAWQMVFYPDPDYAYTVSASFRCFAPRLVEPTERHVMGAEHDQTVIAAAIYAFKKTDAKDPVEREHYRAMYERALAESIDLDRRMVPRSIGQITDPSVCAGADDEYDFGPRFITAAINGVP